MQNKDWDSAASYCQHKYKGHLAAIRNAEEQYAIAAYIERIKKCKLINVLTIQCVFVDLWI